MTVRGGGVPHAAMAFMPSFRMGPPPRSFAADAHHCIMVRVLAPTEYKDAARIFVRDARAPLERYPDHRHGAGVLGAVKVWPGKLGACRKVGAAANLDISCERRRQRTGGSG